MGWWGNIGLSYEDILEEALRWNEKNDPPLSENQVQKTVDSGWRTFDRNIKNLDKDPHKGMIKMGDLAKMNLSIKWIVDKFIPEETITLFSARGGSGKTRLMYKMASCIAEGEPFLKEFKCVKKEVYYIDFENPLALINDMRRGMNLSGKINLWPIHQVNEAYRPKRLSDKDWWEWYNQLKPNSILFIDTLRSSSLGFDENSSGDMGEYTDRLKKLREYLGLTIILEHHTRKGDKRIFRGSSALPDLVDNTLILYLKEFKKKDKEEDSDEEETEFGKTFYFGHGLPGEGKTRYIREGRNIVLVKDKGFIRYEDYLKEEGIAIGSTEEKILEKYDWSDI